jgi:hypothetical protein
MPTPRHGRPPEYVLRTRPAIRISRVGREPLPAGPSPRGNTRGLAETPTMETVAVAAFVAARTTRTRGMRTQRAGAPTMGSPRLLCLCVLCSSASRLIIVDLSLTA